MKRSMNARGRRFAGIGIGLAAALALTAPHAGAHAGHVKTRSVNIEFAAVNGTTPVSCATPLTGIGTGQVTAALKDLRFYISNVRMVRADGRAVPVTLTGNRDYNVTVGANRVTLIDLENATGSCTGDRPMNRSVRGTVPQGKYVGVRMQLGVPFALNHTDITTAPRPLDIADMGWNWQAGRKFTKIEITDPDGAAGAWHTRSFLIHTGSTGCTGNPATGQTANCSRSNRGAIRFARFNPKRQRIAVNLRALFAGNIVSHNQGGALGCMSSVTDPECGPVFDALGIDMDTGAPVAGGSRQRVFRVIPR